jgi:glycerol kinase
MSTSLILAIDQGTTNTKALLVDRLGAPVYRASEPMAILDLDCGHVEQDPLSLWESVLTVMARCSAHAEAIGATIDGVAISNQRETAVAWHAQTGRPLANAISWQCGRSSSICRRLLPHAAEFRSKTGLPLAPLVSAGKWSWLLGSQPELHAMAANGELCFGTVDSWLLYRLTAGAVHATDLSNASRTGLLNLDSVAWDESLLELFGIPGAAMPQLRSSSGTFGLCVHPAELAGVPIVAAAGDSHAAMYGHGSHVAGTVKATYGTGSSLMALTAGLAAETPLLARTIAWSIDAKPQFALEGNIAMAGSAVQWVGEFLGLAQPAEEAVALAATVPDADGIYFVPAMAGLGAPYWDAAARGTVAGLGRSHKAAHLARAAIDAIAYQVADVFLAIEQAAGMPLRELHADGGASRNDGLMQFQADILGHPVLRSPEQELSALGAAWLGGVALGWWNSAAGLEVRSPETFKPQLPQGRREFLCRGWQQAVRRARLADEVSA